MKFTAFADIEIHPDGAKKCDGISIMRVREKGTLSGATLQSPNYSAIFESPFVVTDKSDCVVNLSLAQAEELSKDLALAIKHTKQFCKGPKK